MTCRTCLGEFTPPKKRGLPEAYCSELCRVRARSKRRKMLHPAKYQRHKDRQRSKVAHLSQPCETCGQPAPVFANGKPRKHCDSCHGELCPCGNQKVWGAKQCRQCADQERGSEPRKMTIQKCAYCCHEFKLTIARANQSQVFCSKSCTARARTDLSRPSRFRPFCPVFFPICRCGKQFTTSVGGNKCCSLECRWKLRKTDNCEHCGMEYVPMKGQRMCSLACRKASKKESRIASRKLRKQKGLNHRKHRERARRYGVPYETIMLSKVLERDGPTCMLCGSPTNLTARVPHPRSATLDHVIPMSKGGAHLYSNVQIAHFICNSKRGNKDVKAVWRGLSEKVA